MSMLVVLSGVRFVLGVLIGGDRIGVGGSGSDAMSSSSGLESSFIATDFLPFRLARAGVDWAVGLGVVTGGLGVVTCGSGLGGSLWSVSRYFCSSLS